MKNTNQFNKILTRIQIISSLVWAILLLVSYKLLGEVNKEVTLVLICGFFIEFLLISSSKNNLKKLKNEKA
jgi:predicted tellurium resistance membrane protein TerC